MDKEILKYWLALRAVEDIGCVGFSTLLASFGSPREVFAATVPMLKVIPGIGPRIAGNIRSFSAWRKVEEELDLAETMGIEIVTCKDIRYPRNLLNIYDYPPYLYVRGSLLPDEVCVAVVGSRQASVYGLFTTEKLARELAMKGITVTSGLARGIDSAAHKGALAGRGRTIAVLGSGIDTVYPPENKKLAEKIAENGALVSEFALRTPPSAPNFPSRNRIISGISLGVVVVEAGEKSGPLITARIAAEQGRSVFAVPGEIGLSGSRGTNRLIKQGATLLEGVDDILEEVLPQAGLGVDAPLSPPSEPLFPERTLLSERDLIPQKNPLEKTVAGNVNNAPEGGAGIIFALLSARPVGIDALIGQSGLPVQDVQNHLLTLELTGLIEKLPGRSYIRKEPKI